MPERQRVNPTEQTSADLDRQILLAESNMQRFSGRTLEEVLLTAMGRFNDDPARVAQSLVDQKVFENTADCPDPGLVARAVVDRFIKEGRLYNEESPL